MRVAAVELRKREAKQRLSELARVNRHLTANELGSSIAHELNQPLGAILNNAETVEINAWRSVAGPG